MAVSERLSALTAVTSSLEHLANRRSMGRGGLNDWTIARGSQVNSTPVTRRVLDVVSGPRTTTALHAARVAVGAGLLLPGSGRWRGAGNVFLGLSNAALYPRQRYGTDGSDQVQTLSQTVTGLARLSRSPQTQDALLWYVALQANLSYAVSGWVKLLGPAWRDATALSGIMRTKTYGHEPTYRLTQKYPRAARYLTHGVLGLECLFPVAYLAGGRLARPVIASAAAFHTANGFLMGLGRFVTSFTSMHPMVAYTSAPRSHPNVAGRDDRMPLTAGALVAGAVAVAGGVALQRRLRTVEGWPSSRTVTTRRGNTLQYEMSSGDDPAAPVCVFLAGMVATSEHFAWITEKIVEESGHGVLTYARAGYAGSRYTGTGRFTLAEAVEDLADLVEAAVPAGRKVVLVGHSLGGELARRAAPVLGERLHGIVYLDSSHPGELLRSKQQSETAERLGEGLTRMVWALRGGTGILMSRPDWLETLPPNYRPRAFAQYADARLWEAGRREWTAVEREFHAFDGSLAPVDAHALVLSAQQTVDRDPEQLLMHHELAEAHRGGGRVVETAVLEGADHDTLLTKARFGTEVGDRVLAFIERTAPSAEPERHRTEGASKQ